MGREGIGRGRYDVNEIGRIVLGIARNMGVGREHEARARSGSIPTECVCGIDVLSDQLPPSEVIAKLTYRLYGGIDVRSTRISVSNLELFARRVLHLGIHGSGRKGASSTAGYWACIGTASRL